MRNQSRISLLLKRRRLFEWQEGCDGDTAQVSHLLMFKLLLWDLRGDPVWHTQPIPQSALAALDTDLVLLLDVSGCYTTCPQVGSATFKGA